VAETGLRAVEFAVGAGGVVLECAEGGLVQEGEGQEFVLLALDLRTAGGSGVFFWG